MAEASIPEAPRIDGAEHLHSGKVRDLYRMTSGEYAGKLLMVASDRISAYDFVLDSTIPDKGEILTRMSLWWFEQLRDLVPHHVLSTDVPAQVRGRAVLCEELEMFPVECVARGYLTGSGLLDYQATGEVCGIRLPGGLVEASRLEEPIFTPATKAALGDHDENVSYEAVVDTVGETDAARLRDLTLAVYARAEQIARERGILLADTKLEFGRRPSSSFREPVEGPSSPGPSLPEPVEGSSLPQPVEGPTQPFEGPTQTANSTHPDRQLNEIVLADEVLTPDSSRFWPAEGWQPGRVQPSYDKQIVRNWLTSPESGWDRGSGERPPVLPQEVVDRTRARYVEIYELLTGETF